jgi:hypothetical protein
MQSIKIDTVLPQNINQRNQHFFESRKSYSIRPPKIQFINNAFVSEQGLVLKNFLLNPHCAFNLIGKEDNTFYFPYWKLTLEQMLVCKYGKSLQSIHLEPNVNYLLIHTKWFNYSFWVNSSLVRLIMAEQAGLLPNTQLIYPESWDNIHFVKQSLECFDVSIKKIPHDHHLFVPKLIMPEVREWTASFNPTQIQEVRKKIVPIALKKTTITNFPKRIYLSRKQRAVRCVENEQEIMPILKEFSFEVIYFENLSFWDQVAMMHHAEAFISIHGAGFSNVMFMPPKASVLELINVHYAKAEYQFPFWRLSSAAELNYYAQFCELKPGASKLLIRGNNYDSQKAYLVDENIIVDKDELRKNIVSMCHLTNSF